MKKITSFLMMAVLCCAGAFAQATEYADKLVTIGTAQAEVVPGQWYFLHSSRNPNSSATEFAEVGGTIASAGGFVTDKGLGQAVTLTASSVIDEVTSEEGVSANAYMANFVRFVAVEGEENVYNIQFGTGNWLADNPANGTVNNNNYIAGNAGKYNFYLVTIGGVPNTTGRFAWNKYNMANRVDNNGAGNGVVFYAEGETTGESEGFATDADIKGNKIWQIYDIVVVGNLDKYEETFNALLADYDAICGQAEGTFIDQLKDGVNVGDKPGNYRPEDVNAFLELHNYVEEVIMPTMESEGLEGLQTLYPTAEDLKKFNDDYVAAWNHMISNKVPRAMSGITPGYYTINSSLYWYTTKNDSVFYTQEEADSINNALVEEGYTEEDSMFVAAGGFKEIVSSQVPATIKALMAESSTTSDGTPGQWMAYGPLAPEAKFLWKIEAVPGRPTEYRLLSVLNGKTFVGISQSSANGQLVYNDTATVCFDWRSDEEAIKYTDAEGNVVNDTVTSFNIRAAKHSEGSYNYLHCNGHNSGAGTQNWCVGWSDGGATRWYLAPIDEATVEQWVNGPAAQVKKMVQKGDSIAEAFPAQLKIAKDLKEEVVTDFNQFSSPYSTNDAQSIPSGKNVTYFLIDGNKNTYWHSRWEDGNVEMLKHYLQIDATEALNGDFYIKMTRRAVANDHPTKFVVVGYDANDTSLGLEDGVQLAELEMPFGSNTETILSDTFAISGSRYIRLYAAETRNSSNGESNRGYWHASELNLLNANPEKRYEHSQYDARKAEADALAAAIAVWEENEFDADNLELLEDESFAAAYNALLAAAEAWAKVYVDPAALREAIAAAPAENLFVIGNNPGQWKEGVVTPSATVAAAEAYNASGAYTPAESEAHLAAIAKAEADVWAAANKVETGKWYRFNFPSEEMYETYGWDKTGAQASLSHEIEASPALFGKTIAVGKGLTTYLAYEDENGNVGEVGAKTVEATEEWFDGDQLYYHTDAEFTDGEDLFQFIQATDSTYIIQNKATGLFVRGGSPVTLSAIPTYFYANQAIGAGANVIGWTNIFGEHQQSYLHGQRSDNAMVTWNASTLGSNSMIMIEEVEAVAEAPTTEYTAKMWPGKVYTYTMPVDVKVIDGATAYGAELVVAEEDTTIVLKAIEAETISAGTPFIAIANLDGEYISTADRLKAIKAEIEAKDGELSNNDAVLANTKLNDEYALVEMEHGMEVDTVVTELLGLRGTMKQVTVEAGKGIVANENGFKHTLVNTNVAAHSAYLVSDFDPESTDVLNALVISIEGSIDTGISEVLDKVAKSGNIYNAAGQLVGKGNINTVNSLPAGVYIVNGVKVTKK